MALLTKTIWSILTPPPWGVTNLSRHHFKTILMMRKGHILSSRWKTNSCLDNNSRNTSAVDCGNVNYVTFEEMVDSKRREARKSIVVQVQSEQSCPELYSYCSSYGCVKTMHHYTLPGPSHFVVVEFENDGDVDNVLHNSGHLDTNQIVPVRSPFLWFRISKERNKKSTNESNIPLVETDGNSAPSKNDLFAWMHEAESVSDQMRILHEATTLTSLGSRLRFLTALQIEQALSGPFPKIKVYPFGSTVNGFGKLNCDLDLVLEFDREEASSECRLIFHVKNNLTNGRTQVQRHMEAIGDMCQLFLPGCANVRRILQARVPIVKYRQEFTGVECDLSMTNMSAVYMSELLYVLGSVDERVRPLVQAVRTWARDVGLTNPSPGRWITNFSLTLLVLFYLQQAIPHPVLPSLNKMVSLATNAEKKITAEGINCTFIRDPKKLRKHMESLPKNEESLQNLLLNFFEFYCSFDFSSNAISLGTATTVPKPEHAALYIVNPLERGLNVSKNVSAEEVERLRIELRNAAWTLEGNLKRPSEQSLLWGLVAVCQAPKLQAKGQNLFYIAPKTMEKTRRFNIQDLFEDDLNVKENQYVNRNLIYDSQIALSQHMKNSKQEKSPTVPEPVIVNKKEVRPSRRKKR